MLILLMVVYGTGTKLTNSSANLNQIESVGFLIKSIFVKLILSLSSSGKYTQIEKHK